MQSLEKANQKTKESRQGGVELPTIGIAAVTPNHYTTTGQRVPDKVTFFFVLRHATRPNV